MPRKPRKTDEENFRDTLCEYCHHSVLTNDHGPEHNSGADWCGGCAECQQEEESIPNTRQFPVPSHDAPVGHTINPGDLDDLPPSRRANSMSMIDPSEWELEDSHEPVTLKDGAEALLRIIEITKSTRPETGTEYYTVRLEIPSEPFSKDVTDWFDIPARSMDAKRLNTAKQKMLHFMECFNIDRSRPSDPTEDWIGYEGWCILSLRTSEQYGDQNRISKFVRAR